MKTPTATFLSVSAVIVAAGSAMVINTNIFSSTSALAGTAVAMPVAETPVGDQSTAQPAAPAETSDIEVQVSTVTGDTTVSPQAVRRSASTTVLPAPGDTPITPQGTTVSTIAAATPLPGAPLVVPASSSSPSTTGTTPTSIPSPSEVVVFDVPNIGEVTISRTGALLTITGAGSRFGYEVDVERRAGVLVEVEFESVRAHYIFRARVVADTIVTDISSHSFPVPGGSTTIPGPVEREDDEHGEDEHGEEHDDEDEDEHDDD